jgi:glyoxylase-like metal-dependent hydrolase (beta-lactamase superfamily II)
MIVRQYLHEQPVIAVSYVFGCGSHQAGAVVDPIEAPEFYMEEAAQAGLRIRYVIDTHVHADHISTGHKLATRTGAAYVLHVDAGAEYEYLPVRDGDRLELGNTLVDVMHMPGHTPEHIGLVVTDRTRGDEPWFVLTGHTLMIGDMGRTELASTAEDGARALFESALRLKALPDHVEVLPGAFAGSVCGRGLSGKPWSTIGFERRFNRAFRIDDRATFIARMLQDIPPRPADAERVRAANLGRLAGAEIAAVDSR